MTKDEARNYRMAGDQILLIEKAVQDKIQAFILSQTGFEPALTREWVRRKGNSWHYISTGQTFYGMRVSFMDDPAYPDDFMVEGYSTGFKYASYQYIEREGERRSFLPSGLPAFDEEGEATPELCEWLLNLILEAMVENIHE